MNRPPPAARAVLPGLLVVLVVLAVPAHAAPASHYLPNAGDYVGYVETVTLTNGHGINYTGYSEDSDYHGWVNVTAVRPNGTDAASYTSAGTYRNSSGGTYPWSESGTFAFSALTFRYVGPTDNQTGLTPPVFVWFYVNNSLPVGGTFTSLNTGMTVTSRDATFSDPMSSTGYATAIAASGTGSYYRSDSYGNFTATYSYTAYYDPTTGYVLGYVYTEQDANPDGNGFTLTDSLTVTSASFAVTPAQAPSPSATPFPWLALAVVLVVVVVVVAVVAALAARRRSRGGLGRTPLPRHAAGSTAAPPLYASPPPISLTPDNQPRIQQIVLQETVKVPCRFCGTLIDSTATVCPKCGGPRT